MLNGRTEPFTYDELHTFGDRVCADLGFNVKDVTEVRIDPHSITVTVLESLNPFVVSAREYRAIGTPRELPADENEQETL